MSEHSPPQSAVVHKCPGCYRVVAMEERVPLRCKRCDVMFLFNRLGPWSREVTTVDDLPDDVVLEGGDDG